MPSPRALVAAMGFAGYLGLALSLGNLYPISTFEMYAGYRTTAVSRVIARDSAGGLHEVDEYRDWSCAGPIPLTPAACPDQAPYSYTVYLDREAADYIARHAGSDGEAVEVVRRIFRVSNQPGPPATSDCLLQRCHAVRR